MLVSSNSRLIDRSVGGLLADIEDHDGTIVATGSNESWAGRVEVDRHDARVSGEGVLGPGRVLDGEAADETGGLLKELVGTVRDGKHVFVTGVPAHGRDVLPLGLLRGEAPQGKH